jgi:hypothetical protein
MTPASLPASVMVLHVAAQTHTSLPPIREHQGTGPSPRLTGSEAAAGMHGLRSGI